MKKIGFRIPALAIICAFLTWHFIWMVQAFHPPAHAQMQVTHAFIWFSGPLLLLAGSVVGLYRRWESVKLIKRVLKLHLLLALIGELLLYLIPYKRDYANPSVLDILEVYLGFLIAVNVVLLLILPRSTAKIIPRPLFLTTIVSIAGVMTLLAVWSCATVWIVQWRAAQKAVSLPYCIQVRGYESQYRPASSLSDISGFRMQGKWNHGPTSYRWQDFHAVLIVRSEDDLHYYNWSYLRQNFVPITQQARKNLYLLRPSCEPTVNFITTLN